MKIITEYYRTNESEPIDRQVTTAFNPEFNKYLRIFISTDNACHASIDRVQVYFPDNSSIVFKLEDK